MRVHIPKTAAQAVVSLAYRGVRDVKALERIQPALDGYGSTRAIYVELELTVDQIESLRAASTGKRATHIAELGKLCHDALAALPKPPIVRRGPRRAKRRPSGKDRKCVICGKEYGPDQFAGPRGTRCLECRSMRAVDVRAREIPGGAPGSRR